MPRSGSVTSGMQTACTRSRAGGCPHRGTCLAEPWPPEEEEGQSHGGYCLTQTEEEEIGSSGNDEGSAGVEEGS